MKKLLGLAAVLYSLFLFSQSKIKVTRAGESLPIHGAVVHCNKKILGVTDENGTLEFSTRCRKVEVTADGYNQDHVIVDKIMELSLVPADSNTNDIKTIVLRDKSDPKALEILQKVNDNYYQNSPQSLDSYSFKSYEKFSFDIDEDSVKAYNDFVAHRLDSLNALPKIEMGPKQKRDSIKKMKKMILLTQSKWFLWERAQTFLWSKKYGEKVIVLDNRVSGLQQPLYELMTLGGNRTKMPKEIREENRRLYRFFLTDTIEIDGRKSYVIRFRQIDYKQPKQNRRFNGYLYIDADTYALKKIESNSKIKSDGGITSIWKEFNGKWFLNKENLKVKFGRTVFDRKKSGRNAPKIRLIKPTKFGNYINVTADYFDFKSPIQEKAKDFSGYTMEVQNTDGKLLNEYRTDSLTTREKLTYEKIDSLGKKHRVDQKLTVFKGLLRGNARIGIFDFDLNRILIYNLYEGFRAGIAAKLNEKFNKYISPDIYFGYGFKDGRWKYDLGMDIKTMLRKNSFFRVEYFDDVMAAGRYPENQWSAMMQLMNSGIDLNNDRFFRFKGGKLAYEIDITNGLTMNVSATRQAENATFLYAFLNKNGVFQNFNTLITMKLSPKSKNIMTQSGKYTYEENFPEYYINYEQGWQALGGGLKYSRFDLLYVHNFKSKLGVTGIRAYSGLTIGDTPIWHQFTMNGLGGSEQKTNFNLTSYLGFATMHGGEYYADKFVGFYFTHKIPWYFKSFGKNTSSIDLVYRGTVGNMAHPEYHDFDFSKLNHYYQEAGLEWNDFLSTRFNLGFFYRVGYYATPKFSENFAIQFKLKFLGF